MARASGSKVYLYFMKKGRQARHRIPRNSLFFIIIIFFLGGGGWGAGQGGRCSGELVFFVQVSKRKLGKSVFYGGRGGREKG